MSDFYCCSGMNIGEIKETIENLNSSIEDLDSQEIKVPFTIGKNGLLITPSDFFDKMPTLITGKKFIGGLHNLNIGIGTPVTNFDQITVSNKYFYCCDFSDFSGDFLFDDCIFDTCVMFDVTNDCSNEGYRILNKYYPAVEKNGKETIFGQRPSGKSAFPVCVPTNCIFINPTQNISFDSVLGMTSKRGDNTLILREKTFKKGEPTFNSLKATYGADDPFLGRVTKLIFENCSFAKTDISEITAAWEDCVHFKGCSGILTAPPSWIGKKNQYSTSESLINFIGSILVALYEGKTGNEYTYFWNSPSANSLGLSLYLTSNDDVVNLGKYLQSWDCTSGKSNFSTTKSSAFETIANTFANSLQNLASRVGVNELSPDELGLIYK